MGRPNSSEPRSAQFNLSLTAGELESIKRRAEAAGMRPVHFGRMVLLDQGGTLSRKHENIAVNNSARMIHAQLARLGNNLNQLVRHLHETGDLLPVDLEPLLRDIRQLISNLNAGASP